jgi:hypothetical protein
LFSSESVAKCVENSLFFLIMSLVRFRDSKFLQKHANCCGAVNIRPTMACGSHDVRFICDHLELSM